MPVVMRQTTYVLNQVLERLLRKYRTGKPKLSLFGYLNAITAERNKIIRAPSLSEVLAEFQKDLPTPGLPLTQLSTVKRYSAPGVIDQDKYNEMFTDILSDLTILYETIYEQTTEAVSGLLHFKSMSIGIERRLNDVMSRAAAVPTRKSIGFIAHDNFSDFDNIDFSPNQSGSPVTTALIDINEKCSTLPPMTGKVSKISLVGTEMTYDSTSPNIKVESIAECGLANLLDDNQDTIWCVEAIGPGGGATVDLLVLLPEGSEPTSVSVTPTSYCEITLAQMIDEQEVVLGTRSTADTFSATVRDSEHKHFLIRLARRDGAPLGDQFIYYLGLKGLSFLATQYAHRSEVVSTPYSLPDDMDDVGVGSVRLSVEQDVPNGCNITHYVDYGSGSWVEIDPSSSEWRAVSGRKEVAIDLLGFESATYVNGRPIFDSNQLIPSPVYTSFFREESGVFITNQWRVRSYGYTWPWDTEHQPSPGDWRRLPPGVTPEDVSEIFVDVRPNYNSYIASGRSVLAANRNYLWETYVYVNKSLGVVETDYDTITYSNNLQNIDTDKLLINVYLNGTIVPEVEDSGGDIQLQYNFKEGWNHLQVFVRTKDDNTQPDEIDIGVMLYPKEKSVELQPSTGNLWIPLWDTAFIDPDGSSGATSGVTGDHTDVDDGGTIDTGDYIEIDLDGGNTYEEIILSFGDFATSVEAIGNIRVMLYGQCPTHPGRYYGHVHLWYSLDGGTTWRTVRPPHLHYGMTSAENDTTLWQVGYRGQYHRNSGFLMSFPIGQWGWKYMDIDLHLSDEDDLDNLRLRIVHDKHLYDPLGIDQGLVRIANVRVEIDYREGLTEDYFNPDIDFCRPFRTPLEIVSNFDLAYNTPPLYWRRCAIVEDDTTAGSYRLQVSRDPDPMSRIGISGKEDVTDKGDLIRYRVYYTRLWDTATPTLYRNIRYRGVLENSTGNEDKRPKLYSYTIEVM